MDPSSSSAAAEAVVFAEGEKKTVEDTNDQSNGAAGGPSSDALEAAEVADDVEKAKEAVEGEEDEGATDQEPAAILELPSFRGIVILPPKKQQQHQLQQGYPAMPSDEESVALPPIRADEPTAAIRAVLGEVVGLAHFSNFRLELEDFVPSKSEGANVVAAESLPPRPPPARKPWNPPLISPYTGPDAVVSMPAAFISLDDDGMEAAAASVASARRILEEYADISSLVGHGLQDHCAFRIVLQRYDLASVKDHVVRLRSLLQGSVPALTSLVEEGEDNYEDVEEAEVQGGEAQNEHVPPREDSQKAGENGAANKAKEAPQKPLPPLPPFQTAIDGTKLQDFFYYASGEDPELYRGKLEASAASAAAAKAKKKKKHHHHPTSAKNGTADDGQGGSDVPIEQELREKIPRANELDELCMVECLLQWSPFHPPPPNRRLMGDIGYLMFTIDESPTLHITATPTGFYVNRSTSPTPGGSSTPSARPHFDPSPAPEPCFSHALLDCLLQASPALCKEWSRALEASKERARLNQLLGSVSPDLSYFRYAVRGDFPGYKSPESAAASALGVDATFSTPSWLVPHPRHESYTSDDDGASAWNSNHLHGWDPIRAEEDLAQPIGTDPRGGVRDWNEELQLGRELPTETLQERLDKARLLHKVMSEFAEAVLLGVKAIADGQVPAINAMETARSQVYLHNNIFFSRAIDAGPETFKLVRGDRAARKAANRDLHCNSIFHRMDKPGFFTLATVLVDYLGTRYVCQSVLPGILIGDHGHKILLGSVDSGVPLKWDKELHEALEEKIGKSMMLATRPVLRNPLTQERQDEIDRLKKELPPLPEQPKQNFTAEDADPKAVMMTCLPLEAKGIRGSDNRKYVLDLGRITPRDANWVPQPKGGTGKWEAARKENGKSSTTIPSSLEDEEFYTFVLRPELVTRFTQYRMSKYVRQAQEKLKDSPDVEEEKIFTTPEGKEFLTSLRLNANVLLPDVKKFDAIDDEVAEQYRQDEQLVRDAAAFLWDEVLPKITRVAKDGQISPIPLEGRTLVEFLHRHGVNCRYLGRLAVLAQHEEEKDAKIDDDLKHGRPTYMADGRHKMPKCWLELLETEIVARAAKHVLDSYLIENGAAAAAQPAQLIASFLSAIVSESEETAAQTETRLAKRGVNDPDEDDFAALTISGTGGDGDALPPPIRSRHEVWQDIELEVGRRFRYTLTLYNTGHNKTGRARHVPLLRRVCQRTGVRLLAKNYDVGGRCLCTSGSSQGGKLTASYPISPLDVYDIVPLMKHVAAYNEGFYPCCLWPSPTIPPLQVSLPDTRVAIDAAHSYTSQRALNKGLELASEALGLYQRVTDSQSHPCVVDCMELMATIFHEAEDYGVAALHAEKALSLSIQSGGFDTTTVVNGHFTMYQILMKLRETDRAVKHLRAALYLIELMSGPMHTEAHSSYQRLGNVYQDADYHGKYLSSAVTCFLEAGKRDGYDRLLEGITSMQVSRALAGMGDYKGAIAAGKSGVRVIAMFVGRDHKWTQECEEEVLQYTKLAVQRGTRALLSDKLAEETARANAAADELLSSALVSSPGAAPPVASDDDNHHPKSKGKSNKKKKKGKK